MTCHGAKGVTFIMELAKIERDGAVNQVVRVCRVLTRGHVSSTNGHISLLARWFMPYLLVHEDSCGNRVTH